VAIESEELCDYVSPFCVQKVFHTQAEMNLRCMHCVPAALIANNDKSLTHNVLLLHLAETKVGEDVVCDARKPAQESKA